MSLVDPATATYSTYPREIQYFCLRDPPRALQEALLLVAVAVVVPVAVAAALALALAVA